MTISKQHLAAMRAGRERAQRRRREAAQRRIDAYARWLREDAEAWAQRHTSPEAYGRWQRVNRAMPEIPSDSDYRLVRVDVA